VKLIGRVDWSALVPDGLFSIYESAAAMEGGRRALIWGTARELILTSEVPDGAVLASPAGARLAVYSGGRWLARMMDLETGVDRVVELTVEG